MAAVSPERRLARLAEATTKYPVCERTLRRMVSRGEITGYRLGKRVLFVDLNEVDAALRPVPTAVAS